MVIFEPNNYFIRLTMYNWQYDNWPTFTYSLAPIQAIAISFAQELGAINGLLTALDDHIKQETLIEILISEALKTSEIEGEYMSRIDVMSSIKRNLGLKNQPHIRDKRATGIAELMTTVRESYRQELSIPRILEWHRLLMSSFPKVTAGEWRTGIDPMQVISGSHGREMVHYEAPPSLLVPQQMEEFITWYKEDGISGVDLVTKALIKSAITHLYFESIHPFEDGNGRIGRALAEYALSNVLRSPVLLSISKVIEKDKKQYYAALKEAQATLEITAWIKYFSKTVLEAQIEAKKLVEFTVKKTKFFDRYKGQLNERELKAIHRMMDNGLEGFEGGMTAKKYVAITKTSKATATRDLQHLCAIEVLKASGGGRSVRYDLVL